MSQKRCKLKKTAQSLLKQTVNIYLLVDERSWSKSVEEIVLQVRLDSSFAVFIAMYKASQHTDAGEQIYLS